MTLPVLRVFPPVKDVGFEPRTPISAVWSATFEPPHLRSDRSGKMQNRIPSSVKASDLGRVYSAGILQFKFCEELLNDKLHRFAEAPGQVAAGSISVLKYLVWILAVSAGLGTIF